MILAIDVGNTETTLGLFTGDSLRAHWRLTTDPSRTADELGLMLQSLIRSAGEGVGELQGVVAASVVPPLTAPLREACSAWLGARMISVDASSPLPIVLDVDEPQGVGADRIVNTLAASRLFARDMIVVDLGTATTFDCILADGKFIGGVIAPGVRISAETLFRRTSKLPAPDLTAPRRVIGRRTEECIRSGVVYGAADSIDGIVRRIKGEWPGGTSPFVLATGGLAQSIAEYCSEIDQVDPFLTLQGLRIAHELLTG